MSAIRHLRRAALACALTFLAASPAWAGWDEGQAAYEAGRYADALSHFKPLAEAGDAPAQNRLGYMFHHGVGVTRDFEQALRWYTLAARSGLARAQNNLAGAYREGEGTPENLSQALYWYRLAAQQGFAPSHVGLGYLYEMGLGVPRDASEAVRWYRSAADLGDATGQTYLADMYRAGNGVAVDAAAALMWLQKAADQNAPRAIYLIAEMTEDGEGRTADLAAAIRGFQRAAELGYAPAQAALGAHYADGRGVPRDDRLALQWYQRAADQNNPMAITNLGLMHLDGRGVPVDKPQAVALFRRAADMGQARGMAELGAALIDGQGTAADPVQGVKWLRQATEAGSLFGQFRLAWAYLDGDGVTADAKAAFDLFLKNAEAGYGAGMREFGRRLELGEGGAVDLPQAATWYERAAVEDDDRLAMVRLARLHDNGRGVPISKGHAVYWYVRAARLGDANARNDLGVMYLEGEFVAKDPVIAHALFTLAAEDDQDDGKKNLALVDARLDQSARARARALSDRLRQPAGFDAALDDSLAAAQGLPGQRPPANASPCVPAHPDFTTEQLRAWTVEAPDRGPLWRITKDGRSSHLYGTIHVGRAAWMLIGPRLTQALADSDVLGLEADLSRTDKEAGLLKFTTALKRLDSPALQPALDAALGEACAAHLRQQGTPQAIQAVVLSIQDAAAQHQHADMGLDLLLTATAKHRKLPISVLEPEDRALGAWVAVQEAAVASANLSTNLIRDAKRRAAVLQRLSRGWEIGDVADLEAYEQWCDCANDAATRRAMALLNDDRNLGLAERIDALHKGGQRVLAAVGALHMTGPQGLPKLLAARGYTVERVLPTRPAPAPLGEIRVNRSPASSAR